MAATGLQFNWASVSHGTTNLLHITDVAFTQAIQLQAFHGDDSVYAQVVAAHTGRTTARVTSGDEAALMGIAPGTTATFTATHKDAKHGSSGDIVYSLANAVAGQGEASGAYGQFGR